jgi:hypothetical protein
VIGQLRSGAAFVVLAAALAAGQQQPPRDAVSVATGTASIAGTVFVEDEPKRRARRVRVTLTSIARTSPGRTTTTDDNGAFTFGGLPAGRFEVQAFKHAYLRASYGASRPDRSGTPVVVKDGEAITNLTMTIVRGGVITGVVRDTRGRPVPGMNVRVLRLGYNSLTGERTLGVPSGATVGVTDDRGEYRAFGLPPGTYLVLVPPPPSSGRSNQAIRQLTSGEVRQALQAARSGRSSVPGAAAPPPVASSSVHVDYAPIFHPGVTDIGAAATIALGLGEERAGVDITTQLVPTATITGTVTSLSGPLPQMLSIRLVPAGPHTEMLAGAGLRGVSTQPRPDGTYVFGGVAPGTYTIEAMIGRGRGAPANQPTQWAAAEVHISGQDLAVPLTLQPGVTIEGRVEFEGRRPTPAELESLSVMVAATGSGGQLQSMGGGGRVDADGRFRFAGVTPDTYRFAITWNAPSARDTWTIKSSTANGREAFEAPLRVNANEPVEWVLTFTDTPTTLTGVFQDPGGRAATEYYVLLFSTDRRHWIPGSRRVRTTRPATDGAFTLKGLLPGDYFLVALPDLEPGEWNDPAFLEQLVKSSTRITVRDGETTTQNYRIGGG